MELRSASVIIQSLSPFERVYEESRRKPCATSRQSGGRHGIREFLTEHEAVNQSHDGHQVTAAEEGLRLDDVQALVGRGF